MLGYNFSDNIKINVSSLIIFELATVCLIAMIAILLLSKTIYLDKKKKIEIRNMEDKTVDIREQNAILQRLVNEQFQNKDAHFNDIPLSHRWNLVKKEIDRKNDCFTTRLTVHFPDLKEEEIRLCCLIRIGMDIFGITKNLNISKEYLRTKKSRLAKTLKTRNYKGQLEQFIHEF